MTGKDKCKILKDIRKSIADNNGIEWAVSECTHQGNCKGTCPKCESEVRKLERELSIRRNLGKAVAIAGVSAACVAGLTGCSVQDVVDYGTEFIGNVKEIAEKAIEKGVEIGMEKGAEIAGGGLDVITQQIPEYELSGYIPYEEETTQEEEEIYVLDGEVAYEPEYYD